MSARRLLRPLAIALLVAAAPGRAAAEPPAAPPDGCDPRPALTLHLVNDAGVDPSVLVTAAEETVKIWAEAGLQVRWQTRPPADARAARTLTVILRRTLVRPAHAVPSAHARAHRPLGWIPLRDDGRTANLIELSLSAIASMTKEALVGGRRVGDLPPLWHAPLIGRATGRVLAHEIGHWLWGTRHASEGLMKAALRSGDLVDSRPPSLPRDWAGELEPGAWLARASGCRSGPDA